MPDSQKETREVKPQHFCVAFILANLSMLELVTFLDRTLCSSAVVWTRIDL